MHPSPSHSLPRLQELGYGVLHGDGTEPETWKRFGGAAADGLSLILLTITCSLETARICQALKA